MLERDKLDITVFDCNHRDVRIIQTSHGVKSTYSLKCTHVDVALNGLSTACVREISSPQMYRGAA